MQKKMYVLAMALALALISFQYDAEAATLVNMTFEGCAFGNDGACEGITANSSGGFQVVQNVSKVYYVNSATAYVESPHNTTIENTTWTMTYYQMANNSDSDMYTQFYTQADLTKSYQVFLSIGSDLARITVNRSAAIIVNGAYTLVRNRWYKVTVTRTKLGNISLYIDDNFVNSSADNTFTSGKISFQKTSNEVNWDNITVVANRSLFLNTYDEKTLAAINFNVTVANSTFSATFNNIAQLSEYYDTLPLGDATITISSNGYSTRKYYKTISESSNIVLNAYLLKTTDGQTVRFHIQDSGASPIYNVFTTAEVIIGSAYTSVEQAYSDSSGTATFFLDPATMHNMSFSKSGYTTLEQSIQPSANDYTITLQGTDQTINLSFTYGNIQISVLPRETALVRHSPGIQIFNYTILAPSGDLTSWGWQIQDNDLNMLYNKKFTTATGGTDSYTLNYTNLTYWIYVDTWFNKTGNITWNHMIFNLNNVTRMNNTLSDIIDIMKSGKNITSNLDNVTNTLVIPPRYGFKPETLLIFGLVVTILAMKFASDFFVSNSGGVGVIGLIVLIFISYFEIIPTGMVAAVALGVLALAYLRGVY